MARGSLGEARSNVFGVTGGQGLRRFAVLPLVPPSEETREDGNGENRQHRSCTPGPLPQRRGGCHDRGEEPKAMGIDRLLRDEGFRIVLMQALIHRIHGNQSTQHIALVPDDFFAIADAACHP